MKILKMMILKMNNKIEIKKLQFGSKIDKEGSQNEELYSVKEVLSPNMVELSSGLIVRLLGVEPNPQTAEQACNFIASKTKGHKVFLRFDEVKYNAEDQLMCYLYLENKTFIKTKK